ncbi:hypothetical protein DM45_3868 [Burkholderia mallei]|nr:hypothetical protein DM45_3868 [Burkholderia mallei]CAJ6554783.1 Uncharacterised protein [Burkholderia pseudomallei]
MHSSASATNAPSMRGDSSASSACGGIAIANSIGAIVQIQKPTALRLTPLASDTQVCAARYAATSTWLAFGR